MFLCPLFLFQEVYISLFRIPPSSFFHSSIFRSVSPIVSRRTLQFALQSTLLISAATILQISPTMSSPHILIIGGGVGGLALAQNLKKHGVSFALFERDASASARAQGYRIRVAGGSVDSLRQCLSDELFELFENTCAESQSPMAGVRFNSMDGTSMESLFPKGPNAGPGQGPAWMKMGGPGSRPMGKGYTVDRTMLRNLLLLGQEEHVKFGKSLTHYEITQTGITAFFSDGTTYQGTLLVGADGIFSPVRKQLLPTLRYVDTGSRVIYGKTPLSEELKARFPSKALKSTSIIQDQSLTLFMEPVRFPKDAHAESKGKLASIDDYVYWVLGGNGETFGLADSAFHNLSGKAAADLTLKLTTQWNPSFKALFDLQNTAQTAPLRLISSKPERPDWKPSNNAILMGDAIHAMMPAGGSGANTALTDASLLGRIISEHGVSADTMASFADQMWEYALPAIEGSAQAGKKLLGFKGFKNAKEVAH